MTSSPPEAASALRLWEPHAAAAAAPAVAVVAHAQAAVLGVMLLRFKVMRGRGGLTPGGVMGSVTAVAAAVGASFCEIAAVA